MRTSIRNLIQNHQRVDPLLSERSKGDAARDEREWGAAETAYSAHLAVSPNDQPIWVQYGHSLKEQGKLTSAEAAYRRAIEVLPEDADAYLHLGHVLKLLGQRAEAQQAYMYSAELNPSKAAVDEVVSLGTAEDAQELIASAISHDQEKTIYLEVDDLLDYLRNHRTLSGIQRVQVGIIQYTIDRLETSDQQYAFVRTGKHAAGLWKINYEDLQSIIRYIRQSSVSQSRLLSLIETAEQRAILVEPVRGQTYFVLGAFWGFGSNAARYTKLKRAGVSVGVYIYDLIPITHPEYCAAGLVSEFSFALGDGLYVFDFILTISEYVAEDVRRLLKKHNLRSIPVAAVPLAHQLHASPTISKTTVWRGAIAPLKDRPFVLMVSTIEARKNHIYLYQVWKTLVDEGLDPPDLVFVGRFGWRVNDLRDMLEGTGFLEGRIHVLHDLSDVDLELLYHSCLFTAFPSITEGWGLPVGESLTHGRPSVASKTSSIPEVGGDFVDYIDPWNIHDGVRVIRKMIFDNAYRAERAANIQERFVPRTWDDVGKDLLNAISTLRNASPSPYTPPLLAAGELLAPGSMAIGQIVAANYASRPLRPIFSEHWYPAEPLGSWMRGNEGSVCFTTDYKPGTVITAYLHLLGAPWSEDHTLTLKVGRSSESQRKKAQVFPGSVLTPVETHKINSGTGFLCVVSGVVDQDATITISLKVKGADVQSHPKKYEADDRVFYVGLVELSYTASADVQLRLELQERFLTLLH